MKKDLKIAVLIDADNVTYKNVKGMIEEIAKYGVPTFKRIYGDWTMPTLKGWKTVLLENAITPVQQYGYTTGKNSTDSAMIIDAMDILYSSKVDGFCLVSSDSDFTRLAIRLREASMYVIGIGEKKTPDPFIAACDKFIYIEIIAKDNDLPESNKTSAKAPKKESISKIDSRLIKLIAGSIDDLADEDGWAFLGDVGNLILKKKPNFDPRNYNFLKLTPLIRSLGKFQIDERTTENRNIKHVFIRNK
jgi:uncharacterized LabA/DUF88 family protein/Fe-S-cluster formation regulator IscX/YfhJ